jgi:hypothetical protein
MKESVMFFVIIFLFFIFLAICFLPFFPRSLTHPGEHNLARNRMRLTCKSYLLPSNLMILLDSSQILVSLHSSLGNWIKNLRILENFHLSLHPCCCSLLLRCAMRWSNNLGLSKNRRLKADVSHNLKSYGNSLYALC